MNLETYYAMLEKSYREHWNKYTEGLQELGVEKRISRLEADDINRAAGRTVSIGTHVVLGRALECLACNILRMRRTAKLIRSSSMSSSGGLAAATGSVAGRSQSSHIISAGERGLLEWPPVWWRTMQLSNKGDY